MMIKSHLCSLPRRFFAHGHHKVVCASWTNNRLVLPAIRCFTIKKTGQEHHAFFQEQLQELENERKSFFGDNDDASTSLMSDPISGMSMPKTGKDHHAMFEKQLQELETERASVLGTSSFTQQQKQKEKPENEPPSPEQIEFLHDEREAIFQFSEQEKQAWGRSGPLNTISSDLMQEIEQARQQQGMELKGQQQDTIKTSSDSYGEHHPSFSHVTQDGGSVHMVDVGQKAVTARMAQAQTKVLLPDEVLKAFAATSGELIGPKGPIFATAKLAGIMAAK